LRKGPRRTKSGERLLLRAESLEKRSDYNQRGRVAERRTGIRGSSEGKGQGRKSSLLFLKRGNFSFFKRKLPKKGGGKSPLPARRARGCLLLLKKRGRTSDWRKAFTCRREPGKRVLPPDAFTADEGLLLHSGEGRGYQGKKI